jgi:hypothetical protein
VLIWVVDSGGGVAVFLGLFEDVTRLQMGKGYREGKTNRPIGVPDCNDMGADSR